MKSILKQDHVRASLGASKRAGFMALGFLMVALGVVGAFLPLMPTTIFLILAAWFFGRSSPRLESWMLNHPRFGQTLRDWRTQGAMPRRAKIMACGGMIFGYGLLWFIAKPGIWFAAIAGVLMIVCAVYIVTRPEVTRVGRLDA